MHPLRRTPIVVFAEVTGKCYGGLHGPVLTRVKQMLHCGIFMCSGCVHDITRAPATRRSVLRFIEVSFSRCDVAASLPRCARYLSTHLNPPVAGCRGAFLFPSFSSCSSRFRMWLVLKCFSTFILPMPSGSPSACWVWLCFWSYRFSRRGCSSSLGFTGLNGARWPRLGSRDRVASRP